MRDAALDKVRGLAVVLLLLDHVLVPLQASGRPWLWYLRLLTRPSLPLFMMVSGVLLWRRESPGWIARQFWRVAPWATLATPVGWLVPGFDWLDPLAVYLLALGVVAVCWRARRVALVACVLAALDLRWPVHSYSPWELAAWLLLGAEFACLSWSWASSLPVWLGAVGRRSLWWYVGELVCVAIGCVCLRYV